MDDGFIIPGFIICVKIYERFAHIKIDIEIIKIIYGGIYC